VSAVMPVSTVLSTDEAMQTPSHLPLLTESV
jgi:hypothetical protein